MSHQSERSVILSVCIGGFLEFYEFNLFINLAPILALHYFSAETATEGMVYTLLILAIGFLSRPLGGLLFGYLGDHFGRKIALVSSIIMITLPSLSLSFLPGDISLGLTAPALLLFLRLVQGVLTGGELSGTMCYLTEGIAPERRSFVSSWSFFGPQLGAIFSVLECLVLEQQLTYKQFTSWGWRISFLIGGVIGLLGLFLRYRLRETPLFAKIKEHKQVLHAPILYMFSKYKKHLITAFLLCALPLSSNFLLFSFSAIYFQKALNLNFSTSMILNALINTVCLVSLPFIGKLANKIPIRHFLIACTVALFFLIYPCYLAIDSQILAVAIPITIIVTLLISVFFALLPMLLAELFPTSIRYTALGISYTTASSVLGGTAPIMAVYLMHLTHNHAAPAFILIFTSLLTLFALLSLKESKTLT